VPYHVLQDLLCVEVEDWLAERAPNGYVEFEDKVGALAALHSFQLSSLD